MKVTIDKLAERRLWAFIRAKTVEVGGMGYAYLYDNNLHWTDTFLVPQEVSSSEVDFESTHGDQIAIERATADGVLDEPNFVWVSWHSHHNMNAYWSSTDDARITAMPKVGVNRLLSFVGNHDMKYQMRLDVFGVSAHGVDIGQVKISDLELTSEPADADPFSKEISEELAENVKHKSYSTTYSTNGKGVTTYKKDGKDGKVKKSDDFIPDDSDQDVIDELWGEGYSLEHARELVLSLGAASVRSLKNDNDWSE